MLRRFFKCAQKSNAMSAGGKSDEKPMDDEIKTVFSCSSLCESIQHSFLLIQFVMSQQGAIEKKANQVFAVFEPVSYRTQVVRGLNYFATINVGGQQFAHVTIWKDVIGNPPPVTVTDVTFSGVPKEEIKSPR